METIFNELNSNETFEINGGGVVGACATGLV